MRKIASLFTLLMLYTILAIAQQRTITGKVADESGTAIPNASVVIKGTKTGVSADENGMFRISAKSGDILVISAVGLPNREIRVGGGSTYDVAMSRQNANLAEVVVTAQGVRRQERSLGYAVSKVDPTTLLQKSRARCFKKSSGQSCRCRHSYRAGYTWCCNPHSNQG